VPTPVGPAPRDPNDPDLWHWGDEGPGYHSNGGHDDGALFARLERQRRRRRLIALLVVVVVFAALLAASL
jgi:hypothetical protein